MKKAKKFLTILLAGIMISSCVFTLTSCGARGEVIGLQKAYDEGYLTEEDLLSIAYYWQGTKHNEELMDENYVPKPKDSETLNSRTEKKIIKTYAEYIRKRETLLKEQEKQIKILNYYGHYGKCYAVKIRDPLVEFPAVIEYYNILIETKKGNICFEGCKCSEFLKIIYIK